MSVPDRSEQSWTPSAGLVVAVVLLALVGTLGGLLGGPAMGHHEAQFAQCARDMRLSGDWLVPRYLDTPFMRKPPLTYWLIAAASYLFPNDAQTGLPVTTGVARLPSAVAAFGTVLILWRLASAMFGRRTGLVTGVLAGSSLCFLLYSANATAEMLLTLCCTWAYAHFWFAVTARDGRRRTLHALLFYLALGFAMLAKGPVPLPLVAAPLVAWWYTELPLRVLARGGRGTLRRAAAGFVRCLWPRTRAAFTQFWVLPGLVVFAAVFVPWMWAVAARHPHAWNLWNWQYLQRAQGNYEDTRIRGPFYYLPMVAGYVVPWLFLIVEAAAAPWLKRYAPRRRPLLYAGMWAALGIGFMSLMSFKKPYYIVSALPGLILLSSVVAARFFGGRPIAALRARWLGWGLAVGAGVALAGGSFWLRHAAPAVSTRLTFVTAGALALLLLAAAAYRRGRGEMALGLIALTAIGTFHTVWYTCGPTLDNLDKVADLVRTFDGCGIPRDAQIAWADQYPDARLSFYFDRRTSQMVTPEEIVKRVVDRTRGKQTLEQMALDRAAELLDAPQPVYLVMDRKSYEQWREAISAHGRLLPCAQGGTPPDPKDWVVLSNVEAR
jgi:4-amino-4-deoxy-L-arabinose transferase-like glycosyltransferase